MLKKKEVVIYDASQVFTKGVKVFEKNPFLKTVNMGSVLRKIRAKVPNPLYRLIEVIYISEYSSDTNDEFSEKFKKRQVLFEDSCIFVWNELEDESEIVAGIVREIGRATEKHTERYLYADGQLEAEFRAKRKEIRDQLDQEDDLSFFDDIEYSPEFEIVADSLNLSPFTYSINEYFVNGFLHYILGDKKSMKEISPALYKKINTIVQNNSQKP